MVLSPKTTATNHVVILKTVLTLQLIYLITTASGIGLQPTYDCACLGNSVLYECTVSGDGTTVWRGGAFNCPDSNNEITLINGMDSTRECNNGEITGRSFHSQPTEQIYISQLKVRVGPDTNDTTIECIHDDGANLTEVGSTVLIITTEPLPPPNDLYFVKMTPDELIFEWSEVMSNCPLFHYHITSSNCGQCPNTTNSTTTTCTGNFTQPTNCLFAVQSVVCGDIFGDSKNMTFTEVDEEQSSDTDSTVTASEENHLSMKSSEIIPKLLYTLNPQSIFLYMHAGAGLDTGFVIITTAVSVVVLMGVTFTLGTALVCIMLTRKVSRAQTENTTTSPKPETNTEQNEDQVNAIYSLLQPTASDLEIEAHSRGVEATVIYAEVDDHARTGVKTLKPFDDDRVQYSEIERPTELVCDQHYSHGLNLEQEMSQSGMTEDHHSQHTHMGGRTTNDCTVDTVHHTDNSGDDEREFPPKLPPRRY